MDNYTTSSKPAELSLKDIILMISHLFRYLLSKWVLILLCGLMGAIAGLAYSFVAKPQYKAEFSFALEDAKQGGGLSAYAGIASQFGVDIGGGGGGIFSDDNLPEIMKSQLIIQKTLLSDVVINNKKQTLADLYIDFNDLREKWSTPDLKNIHYLPGADPDKFSRTQDSVLRVLHDELVDKNLTVDKKDKKLTIITATLITKNELFSKIFIERLVKETSDFYILTKTKKSTENVKVLQTQTDSVRRALSKAISGQALSVDANPNPNPALQVLRVPSQNKQVEVQANTAILSELVKYLETAKVSLRKETPLIQAIDTPKLPLIKQKVSKAKGVLTGGVIGAVLILIILILKMIYKKTIAV